MELFMKKFYMLLLSATICATTAAFGMDPFEKEKKNLTLLKNLSPQEITQFADDELGHILKHWGMSDSEYYQETALPTESFSSKTVEAQGHSSLPVELFNPNYSGAAQPIVSPLEIEQSFETAFNASHKNDVTCLELSSALTRENINSFLLKKDGYFKLKNNANIYRVENAENLEKTYNYLVSTSEYRTLELEKPNIELMQQDKKEVEDKIIFSFTSGNAVKNPLGKLPGFADIDDIVFDFEPQTIVLKKVDLTQFIINAPVVVPAIETAEYSGGVTLETIPQG
jgi:hypothetical protein